MSKQDINDDLLSEYIRKVEIKMLDNLPKEEELNHRFSKSFNKKMKKLIRQEKRTSFMKSFIMYGKRVAIIFLIIISISFATTMSVEAYRVKFFEVITEVWEEFTSIIFEGKEEINDSRLVPVNTDYLPEGFSILEEEINDYTNRIIYINTDNKEIFYEQNLISTGEILLDTENTEIKTMKVEDQRISYFSNKDVNQVYWNDDTNTYTLISSIDIEEIIKIVTSILKK